MKLVPSNIEGNSTFNLTWYPQGPKNLVDSKVMVSPHSFHGPVSINGTSQSVLIRLNHSILYNISIYLSACSNEVNSTFTFSKYTIARHSL